VSCHLSVREHGQEPVDDIVGQCPPIVRKARRSARVLRQNVWQQLSRDAYCVLWRIVACVSQLVREDADEATIIRWLSTEVCLPLVSGEENRLQWPATAICLHPAFGSLVQCASPNSHPPASQIRVRQFNHDAADVLVEEEVVPRELHVIEIAVYVGKERIAAPTEEEPVLTGFGHHGFSPDRDRYLLDDNSTLLAHASGLHALNPANCRSLLRVFGSSEPDAISEFGNRSAIRCNVHLV